MNKSAEEIEREVEESRARLDRTLDSLQSRLNVTDIAKNLGGLRQPGVLQGRAERLAAEARANPVPVLLICAGLGYLVFDTVRQAAQRDRLATLTDGPNVPALKADLAENHPDRLNDRLEQSAPSSNPASVNTTK